MAKNDDGEFELVLGNNQLLSVFFLVVLLLALCFIGGYTVGRNGAPTLAAANAIVTPDGLKDDARKESKVLVAQEDTKPELESPAIVTPSAKRKEEPAPQPPKLTPKAEAKVAEAKPIETKAAEVKPTPPPAPAGKQPPVSSQPVSGRVYLQLSATDKDKAEAMVDLIRSKSMPAIAAVIPDRPNLYRVLVGPLTESTLAETREQLKADGFPGGDAIRRVF